MGGRRRRRRAAPLATHAGPARLAAPPLARPRERLRNQATKVLVPGWRVTSPLRKHQATVRASHATALPGRGHLHDPLMRALFRQPLSNAPPL
jgi:hypothetical protein